MIVLPIFSRFWAKVLVIAISIVLVSCNAVKKVPEGQFLLTENTIFADSLKVADPEVRGLLTQRPNGSILGYPFRLNLYNLAKENPDSLYQDWLERKPKRQQRLNRLLSKKQVDRLGESFVVRGFSNLLKRVGEPPSIIDTARVEKSIERLQYYYGSKGYFNNEASFALKPATRPRRAALEFKMDLGKPYFLDSISRNILSQDLDSLYAIHESESLLQEGEQFDLAHFNSERQRLTDIYRNSGVYNFQESSINYDILRDTLQVNNDQGMTVQLNIKNLRSASDTSNVTEYRIHKFDKINIYADYELNKSNDSLQTLDYGGYTIYYKDKLKYRPKALTDAIFFEKDSIYRQIDESRSKRQLVNLNTFKYPSFKLLPDTTQALLTSNIYLVPRPKFSLDTSLELTRSNIQLVGIGFRGSVISRNIFGGAETLSLSLRGSVGFLDEPDFDDAFSDENFTSEIGGDINLTFPRIWFPWNTERLIPYYMLPQTRLSAGTNFQRNIGLDRRSLNAVQSYSWSPDSKRRNTVELLNIEFVRNTDTFDFFNVYGNTYANLDAIADGFDGILENANAPDEDFPELASFFESVDQPIDSLRLSIPSGADSFIETVTQPGFPISTEDLREVRRIEERRDRLTSDNLIFTTNYTFQKNNRESINDNSFFQYRVRFESAGNTLALLENIIPFNQKDGQGLVFSVPYSQYLKTEFDYIKHWDFRSSKVLAFHSFFGLAVPYGNSNSIPFVRSYFAGGSNDNRAWNVYTLGPGRTNNENDFNEANLKIGLNLEYRFPLVGDVKGALFADAGNIWNVFDNVDDPEAKFNGFESLADIALGTGFGLRYDFTYFVIRGDLGFKTYNPALEGADRWFTDFNFREAVFNIGINYPF
ncbi:MAG: BamA/TamA family outer membrane protein [Bacteroidota bacterium]